MDTITPCGHCGQPVPPGAPRARIGGVESPVCCEGCAAAAQWIGDAGLEDYYRLRSQSGPRPDQALPDFAAWLHPEVLAGHVVAVEGGLELTLVTDGMRCAACAWLIDRSLHRLPGVLEVSANAVTGRIRVTWNPAVAALVTILEHLHRLGFAPYLVHDAAGEAANRVRRRRELLRIGVAGLGAMQAMMFAEAVYLDTAGEMATSTRDFFRWIAFLVSTPVVFFSGWPFLSGMARELRLQRLGMDTLVGSSVLLAYLASLVETARGGPQIWFDAAVMFVLFLLVARQLEQWARDKARAHVDVLARARPVLVTRETGAGREQVPVAALAAGDVVCVAPGEIVAADGALLAPSSFDESLLTGEPLPVAKAAGDTVLAGSTCAGAATRLRVTATGPDTWLSMLQRLIERAQRERPPVARLADRVASVFVTVLFAVAALVFVAWLQVEPGRAFPVALAVLVVSCPCALSLAIPAALATAHGELARRGVLPVRAGALETLAELDTVVLDKTGTLTAGRPRIVGVAGFDEVAPGEAFALAASLQQGSRHPIARAFSADAGSRIPSADGVRDVPGEGIEGRVGGRLLRLGRAAFAAARPDDTGIWLGDGARAFARFDLADALRDDAAAAVAALRGMGIEMTLSSGDAADNVAAVAAQVGIDAADASARQSPEAKLARVRERQQAGRRVAMIGDGVNDAAVLAGADVSFALGSGAAVAHRHADFVIVRDALMLVPQTFALARRTRRIVRQSLAWAIGYNLVALPFAALGWVEPWLAALGMAASSLLVTLNALRVRGRDSTTDQAGAPRGQGGRTTASPSGPAHVTTSTGAGDSRSTAEGTRTGGTGTANPASATRGDRDRSASDGVVSETPRKTETAAAVPPAAGAAMKARAARA